MIYRFCLLGHLTQHWYNVLIKRKKENWHIKLKARVVQINNTFSTQTEKQPEKSIIFYPVGQFDPNNTPWVDKICFKRA